jgi:DNA polymerase-3 subunit delta'
MPIPYPWQQRQWNNIQQQILAHKLPHALLICGQPGLGKLGFAIELAHSLLCSLSDEEGRACGRCQSCQLCASDSHPDLHIVTREEDKRQIRIDQIRTLCEFMVLSRQFDRYKVSVVCEADKLNNNAANGLLKTLEEPPPYSHIILVSSSLLQIPPTLRSRCQQMAFSVPSRESGALWLSEQLPACNSGLLISLAHGQPLTARELADGDQMQDRKMAFDVLMRLLASRVSAVAAAKQLEKIDLSQLLDWFISWLMDAVRLQLNAQANCLDNPDFHQELNGISRSSDLSCFYGLMDEMIEFKRLLVNSLNPQLLLEDIVLAWSTSWHNSQRIAHVRQQQGYPLSRD